MPRNNPRLCFFIIAILLLNLNSCSDNKNNIPFSLPDAKEIQNIEIERIDQAIENFANADSVTRASILDHYSEELKNFGMFIAGTDSVDSEIVSVWSSLPATTAFMPEINRTYESMTQEEQAIARVLATMRTNNLNIKFDRFAAVTWSDRRSIVTVDDGSRLVFIALNHYLGANSPAYSGWPEFVKALKTRRMIPVDVAEALIATSYPYDTGAQKATILSRLLYEGALATAKRASVPDATLAEILGLTEDALEQTRDNESFIWRQLITDNKLYSSDADLMHNLFDMRPSSSRISNDAPGRAVRYVGYRIVEDYLKYNPDVSLEFLLTPAFYNNGTDVLRSSGYNPS